MGGLAASLLVACALTLMIWRCRRPPALTFLLPTRLTEQTLDSCQLKRSRGVPVRVDLRWLCNHLAKWGMLGRDFTLQVGLDFFATQLLQSVINKHNIIKI